MIELIFHYRYRPTNVDMLSTCQIKNTFKHISEDTMLNIGKGYVHIYSKVS